MGGIRARVQRLFRYFLLLAFVLEVINPSSAFVREKVPARSRAGSRKVARLHAPGAPATDGAPTSVDSPDDDDYVVCNAVVPSTALPVRPYASVEIDVPFTLGHPERFSRTPYRPPAVRC